MKPHLYQLVLSFCFVFQLHTSAAVRYVNMNNSSPATPYTSWATAAINIQDAIDASTNGDLVLVTNGVYSTGGRVVYGTLTNRVAVTKPILLRSVNGPVVTVIEGSQTDSGNAAIRCVYLTNGASLFGFTLTNGATHATGIWAQEGYGGGVSCESPDAIVSNCVIIGNTAAVGGGGAYYGTLNNCCVRNNSSYVDVGGGTYGSVLVNSVLADNLAYISGGGAANAILINCTLTNNWGAQEGGGAWGALLVGCLIKNNSAGNDGGGVASCIADNCLIVSNTASYSGGGANYYGVLNNCSIVGNSAPNGGGASYVTLNNCIVYYNTPNNCDTCDINHCCTVPVLSDIFSITNEPMFVGMTYGDFRLQSNSLCINSGDNSCATVTNDVSQFEANHFIVGGDPFVAATNDLNGNPRIVGGTVDIGAFEYQTPTSVLSYAWAQQYGLPTDGSVDYVDLDGTGFNVFQDWVAGLNPTNALSVLAMLPPAPTNNPTGLVVTWQSVNTRTYFLQSSTNLGAKPAFSTIQSNIIGKTGTTTYMDITATNSGPYFYRVGVQ